MKEGEAEFENLKRAIESDDLNVVRAAVASGSTVNHPGVGGLTPASYAVRIRKPRSLAALLAAGADPAIRDDTGHNAITLAVTLYDREPVFLDHLLAAGADPNILWPNGDPLITHFLAHRNLVAIDYMHRHGADIDARDRLNQALIVTAAYAEDWDVVLRLLELGAKYDFAAEPNNLFRAFGEPSMTTPRSPLYPEKTRAADFLRARGFLLPDPWK